MTEEIAATPGWAEERVDELFAPFPDTPGIRAARNAYLSCLAAQKSPAAPSDMLGAEFNGCRTTLRRALEAEGLDGWDALDGKLEKLEAEIAGES